MTINNNNIFGAFTLGEVRSGQLTGNWLNKEYVANYGWFGGGFIPGPSAVLTVDRIDFSNDSVSATARGSLSSARGSLGATGNSNYGWFGGSGVKVDRIDFSNDSATASVRGPLSSSRYGSAATGNSNYGWFGGGSINPALIPPVSTVDRIDFSNDFGTASVRGSLSLARDFYGPGTGNFNYGWFGGGENRSPSGTKYSTVDRIDFSNDFTIASPRSPLNSARYSLGATGNSNYGWFGGGGFYPAVYSTVQRLDFSNDSVSALVRGSLSSARYGLSASGNSNYGWFGGGLGVTASPPISNIYYSTVDRITFSNDSVSATTRGSLTQSRYWGAATSGVLNKRRQKSGSYGWFGGGGFPAVSIVDRVDFSNDSATASVRGSLSLARYASAATGNSNYGWFGGGSPGGRSTVDRVNFSNDSSTASVRGPLSSGKGYLAATGNSNYGWFGFVNGKKDRIDFSNDFAKALARGPSSSPSFTFMAATGNSNYGWFGGGIPGPVSTVERIDFSNDSETSLIRGPLSSTRYALAATGNSNYGWFGGASSPSPPPPVGISIITYSIVDRINFANDSVSASPRGPLSTNRGNLAATGNSNYGWFGGGVGPGYSARISIDRINFANDSVTASPRGSLNPSRNASPATQLIAATSNTTR